MAKIGFLGSLLTSGGSGVERSVRELLKAYRRDFDVRVYRFAPPGALGKALRILWEQAVVPLLLARDKPDFLVAPAYVAPVLSPVPVELHVYDLHVFTHPATCSFANRLHYRALMPLSIRRARRVVVPSTKVRDEIARRFPDCAAKIEVVPLGIDRAVFRPAAGDPGFPGRARALRARLGLPWRFALFVGNVAPRKNIASLAGHGLPLPLVIAGRVRERGRLAMPSAIFAGRLSDGEVADLYRMAFALVHPAKDEGFGLTILEAMACGCPVIASPAIAPELMAGVAATAVTPEEFSDALSALLGSEAARDKAVARGLALAGGFEWRHPGAGDSGPGVGGTPVS